MSEFASNTVELFVGDTIQLDGGAAIVEAVGSKTADCIDLKTGKLRQVDAQLTRSRILERGGQPALDKFKAKAAGSKPHLVRLELGDRLCYRGKPATVVAVADKRAVVGHYDGAEFAEDRELNANYFVDCATRQPNRLDAAGRAKNLAAFLAARTPPAARAARAEQTEEENNQQKEKEVMAKKNKVKSNKKESVETNGRFKIMGQSPCRVLVSLGRAGVTTRHAIEIMKAQGAKMSDATVASYSYDGRAGKGNPAELTKSQVSELIASAKDPQPAK